MGKYLDYLKFCWNQGAEKGKTMKQNDKDYLKKKFKKGDKK